MNLRLFISRRSGEIPGMDISTIANVATAATVLTGVIFGWFEGAPFSAGTRRAGRL